MFKIAFGYDPNAADFARSLMAHCEKSGYAVIDLGGEDPVYANAAFRVAEYVRDGKARRGVLTCGTGIGMCIAANKVQGVSAAVIGDVYSAQRAALSNNAKIACLGAFTMGAKLAEALLDTWLPLEFEQGCSSQPKVDRIAEYDAGRG